MYGGSLRQHDLVAEASSNQTRQSLKAIDNLCCKMLKA